MATPRIFNLSSSLIRRAHRRTFAFLPHSPPILRLSSPLPPRRLSSTPLPRPLPSFRFYSVAAALDTEETAAAAAVGAPAANTDDITVDPPVSDPDDTGAVSPGTSASHPWPEWEVFVDKLNRKGYFAADLAPGVATAEDNKAGGVRLAAVTAESYATMEQNRLKNACLKFARERFDILRSLPKEDIQAIVECGCPNLFRKTVNSAKRLRAFLTLDEGHVCNGCTLKDSCDKAYIIPNEDEAARTVDVVRVLLTYAIKPEDLSSENPPVKMQVQQSARRLLSELIELSDTTIDPALLKPVVQSPGQKKSSHKAFDRRKSSEPIEMKKGDWLCPKCNYMNFARNTRCIECKEEGPKRVDFDAAEMKLGDWTCPSCQFMNFARNKTCKRCQESHQRELNPGEWECPSCNYVNFARNRACRKCDCARPSDKGSRFDDHAWRKPKLSDRNSSFKFGATDDEVGDDEDDRILPLEEDTRSVARKRTTFAERSSKPGEWSCPSCDFLNFARNTVCKKCNRARPNGDGQFDDRVRSKPKSSISRTTFKFGDDDDEKDEDILLFRDGKSRTSAEAGPKAGDWNCPSCEFANFSRNKVCKKCKCARPNHDNTQFGDGRKLKSSNTRTPSKFSDDDGFFDDFDRDSDDEDEILPLENKKKRLVGSKRVTLDDRED